MKDMLNKEYGRLKVVSFHGLNSHRGAMWNCLCICGKMVTVHGASLRQGSTKSCGCLYREKAKERFTTHGMSTTSIYAVWERIHTRCNTKQESRYKVYKNIAVCSEWREFLPFYRWAKDKYKKGLVIDRKDTHGDYSPSNCRFVTQKINSQNTTRAKWWVVDGKQFESLREAGKYWKVHCTTILYWCCGKKIGGISYPPKANCFAIKKYQL